MLKFRKNIKCKSCILFLEIILLKKELKIPRYRTNPFVWYCISGSTIE